LTLLALVGIVDPPRPEARDAIKIATEAGIKVRMITGDHVVTAGAIGHQLGITGAAMAGADLNNMEDDELIERIDSVGIIGRVAPEHKVRIVEILQRKGAITAMTGDGVNDAPALKTADIGIAMGVTGTEVSKQAATMILTDDNFATIVKAVELGRAIYDNLLKYLRFQLITLVGYIVLFVGSMALNVALGAPLDPLQILWLNFLVGVPLALGLGRDKPALDLMQRKPRQSDEAIINPQLRNKMLVVGFVLAVATLLPPDLAGFPLIGKLEPVAATMILSTISLTHVYIALESRSETRSLFDSADFPDSTFIIPMVISLSLTFLVTEAGFLQRWFNTTSMTLPQWLLCILSAALVLVAMEIMKWFGRRQSAS
jgi:Ca2+-transporting ATPase